MTRAPALALLLAAAPALADDLTPPPWRFAAGSTVQHWDFSAGAVASSPPDALPLNNPFGTPMFTPSSGAVWGSPFAGRTGTWGLFPGSSLAFDIPNTGNASNQKELWLQVTFYTTPPPAPAPLYSVGSTLGSFSLLSTQTTPLANGWYHQLTRWLSPVCPPLERITISSSATVAVLPIDQVVVDTLCFVPSPSSFSLLAGTGLVALRRRR